MKKNLKVLYIVDQDIGTGTTAGIIYKVQDKIIEWKRQGIEASILSLYSFTLYDADLNVINDKYKFSLQKHSKFFTLLRLIISTFYLNLYLNKFDFELVYMRARLYTPFIKRFFKRNKVIIEINTDDVEEWKCNNKIISIYNNLTRRLFYSGAIGFVSVSRELANRYSNFKKPTIVIANGINVDGYQFFSNPENEKPLLCFVGSPGFKWFGIEKIEYIASQSPEFDFLMIGMQGEDRENIKYLGYLELDKLKIIVAKCDVALSSMSLYVKKMEEASALKSRQYLAHGIPMIYSYIDTDLNGKESFVLAIPNEESNVRDSLQDIKKFVNFCYQNSAIRKEAREFALSNLDVKVKESKRLKFFKDLIKG